MRKFLGTLVILVILIGVVGYFRGWFSLSTENQPGVTNVELTIDKDKVKQDEQEVVRRAQQLGEVPTGQKPERPQDQN